MADENENLQRVPARYRIWDGVDHYDDIDPMWSLADVQAMARGVASLNGKHVRLVEITETEIPFA